MVADFPYKLFEVDAFQVYLACLLTTLVTEIRAVSFVIIVAALTFSEPQRIYSEVTPLESGNLECSAQVTSGAPASTLIFNTHHTCSVQRNYV